MAVNTKPHIKPGVITAAVLIALTLFFYFTGIKTGNQWQMILRILVVIAGVAVACNAYSKAVPGLTGKEIFFFGFRVTAIATLCSIAFAVLFVLLIPQFKNEAIAAFQKDQLTANDGKSFDAATIAENVAMYKKRFLTLFIGLNMMVVVLSGFIGALAGVLISKKK
jgi:Protein of unknown function (DUF4199)